jgi:hypothetical protein
MTFVVDGTNGLTFNDATTQASTATNASNISSGTLGKARLPTGSVLQVQSTTKTNTFSTATTGSYVDITGLSVSITPTSATSKILIIFHVSVGPSDILSVQLVRNSTAICIGDAGNGFQATLGGVPSPSNGDKSFPMAGNFLDSPATTSSTTYKIQMRNYAGTSFVNQTVNDTNASYTARSTSTITVMEIAA